MPKNFLVQSGDLLKPLSDELRRLSLSVSEWHPSDMETMEQDVNAIGEVWGQAHHVVKALKVAFPPYDDEE